MDTQAALSVVDCFTLILDGLLKAIAAKIADYPFTSEMVTNLWNLVNTVKNCFLRLAALVQAGNISRERPAKPRARRRGRGGEGLRGSTGGNGCRCRGSLGCAG